MRRSSSKTPRAVLATAFALCACAGFVPAQAQSVPGPVVYRLDPAHTWVTFEVRHFWTSTVRGRIGPVSGQVTLDRGARSGEVRLRIPVATVSTGMPAFDARVKEADLLATADYPEAYFVATRFTFDDAGGVKEVRGEFTFRGVGQALSLVAQRFACRQDERLHKEVCGGDFVGQIPRHEFGASFGEPFVSDDVRLVVQVEAIAP